ncbi:MAG: hypothetical protein JXR14_08230 [Paracoccaceae bacterium]
MSQATTDFPKHETASRDLRRVLLALSCLAVLFLAAPLLVFFAGGTSGISKAFFLTVDIPGLITVFLTFLALSALAVLPPVARILSSVTPLVLPVSAIAVATFSLSAISVDLVYQNYALSMDEWMTRLQAEIFLSGQLSSTVPEEWRPFGRAMFQSFASYDPATGTLASNYRPGMSALYAAFDLVGLGVYTSAMMNALAVVLVARVARQVFPDSAEAPVLAALLLATSQQALAASLTSYAMSAHLCFNLLWLTLFLHNRLTTHVLAALVGVATASLHQVHFHLFFALPFLLTLLRPFRPRPVMLYAGIYLVGHLAVLSWDWWSFNSVVRSGAALPPVANNVTPVLSAHQAPSLLERISAMARVPSVSDLASVAVNIVRMMSWQSAALIPLLLIARPYLRTNKTLMLLIWSLAVSTLPYPFLMPDQGHGWGYRYLHGLLGHLALLAIPGWIALRALGRPRPYLAWVVACLLLSPLVLLPFRGYQIHAMVEPYAMASSFVSEQKSDVTIVDSYRIFIGNDIPRNSPIRIETPITMSLYHLTPDQVRELCGKYDVTIPATETFSEMGLPVFQDAHPDLSDRYSAVQEAISACNP